MQSPASACGVTTCSMIPAKIKTPSPSAAICAACRRRSCRRPRLQLWTRNHSLPGPRSKTSYGRLRTLVKTSLMRQTLHFVPTDEFAIYIAALRPSRYAQAMRVMDRCGITREESEAIIPLIMETLSAGPLSRPAIAAAIRPKASKQVRFWMENSWSLVRLPIAEGLICYGRGEGNAIVFIRVDRWLPKLKLERMSATEAQCILLRKYLRAYGPATLHDFAHWAGLPIQEVKPLRALLESELTEIPLGDRKQSLAARGCCRPKRQPKVKSFDSPAPELRCLSASPSRKRSPAERAALQARLPQPGLDLARGANQWRNRRRLVTQTSWQEAAV